MNLEQATAKTLEGMKLCVTRWYDTGGGHALASIYLHLYNDHANPKPRLLDAVCDSEVLPYLFAACIIRNAGYEPHTLGGDSDALMTQIIKDYGPRRRRRKAK